MLINGIVCQSQLPAIGHCPMLNVKLPGGSVVKNLPANAGDAKIFLGQKNPLEKEMATHSSILA